MAHIRIENLKPIKKIEFDLKQVNLFIGPQSSGKSTILKVISFCRWLEKYIYNDEKRKPLYNANFKALLCSFHRININAFDKNTKIEYKGDFLTINYNGEGNAIITVKPEPVHYNNNKLAYIPSERNFVSAIPKLRATYKSQEYDNILNYVYEWTETRESYQKRFFINKLNIEYQYNKELDLDRVFLQDKEEISLAMASSGLQSVIPLFIQLDYYTKTIFVKGPQQPSVDERENFFSKYNNLKDNKISLDEYMHQMRQYRYSQLFIEEPEQNLFPIAQKDLLEEIIKGIVNSGHDNYLFMTTHSPYIITSMNNLIEAAETGIKHEAEVQNLIDKSYWLPFGKVNAFFIKDGVAISLLDEEFKMIGADEIDTVSEDINNIHYKLSDIE